jgi:hypothetical protein
MNVEIRTEAAQFPEKEYINGIFLHRKKKIREFPVPSRDFTLGGNNDVITELFLPRGSLVSHILAGYGKLVNLFLRCSSAAIAVHVDVLSSSDAAAGCERRTMGGGGPEPSYVVFTHDVNKLARLPI